MKANNELQTAAQLQHGHSVLHTIRVTIIVSHAMIPKTICKAHNRLITCWQQHSINTLYPSHCLTCFKLSKLQFACHLFNTMPISANQRDRI